MEKIYDEFLRRRTTPTSNKRELCPYIHVYTICILQHRKLTKWHMVVVCWLVLWTSFLIFYFQNSSFLNYLLASAPEHWTCNLFTHLRSLCSNLNKWASSRLSFNYAYETESLHTHCKYSFIHCKYLYGWVLMLSASLLIWNQDLRHFGPDFCNLLISTSSLCKLV